MTLSEKLKLYRKKSGLSVNEVAIKLNVSPSTYREWEYGRKIQGEPYLKICKLYQIGLNELLDNPNYTQSELNGLINDVKISLQKIEIICESFF